MAEVTEPVNVRKSTRLRREYCCIMYRTNHGDCNCENMKFICPIESGYDDDIADPTFDPKKMPNKLKKGVRKPGRPPKNGIHSKKKTPGKRGRPQKDGIQSKKKTPGKRGRPKKDETCLKKKTSGKRGRPKKINKNSNSDKPSPSNSDDYLQVMHIGVTGPKKVWYRNYVNECTQKKKESEKKMDISPEMSEVPSATNILYCLVMIFRPCTPKKYENVKFEKIQQQCNQNANL